MEFKLTKACEDAFQCCKEEIFKNITFPYFNPKASKILQTDASKKGLGAVILQNSKTVMFASMALTGSKKNYQNLERECLATILGHGKIPLLPILKGIYLGNGSEATSIHLQEAYGGNFPKDLEVSSQKISIPTLQYPIQERCGNSTS